VPKPFIPPTSPSSQSHPGQLAEAGPRSPADCPRSSKRNEMESFMEAARAQNWAVEPQEENMCSDNVIKCRSVKLTLLTELVYKSRHTSVGIAIGYMLDDGGVRVRVPVATRIITSPRRLDRLWGPLSLLSSGYRGFFPRG
jgi:hypothetical protein